MPKKKEVTEEVIEKKVEPVVEEPKKVVKKAPKKEQPTKPETVTVKVSGQKVTGLKRGNRLVTPSGVTYAI